MVRARRISGSRIGLRLAAVHAPRSESPPRPRKSTSSSSEPRAAGAGDAARRAALRRPAVRGDEARGRRDDRRRAAAPRAAPTTWRTCRRRASRTSPSTRCCRPSGCACATASRCRGSTSRATSSTRQAKQGDVGVRRAVGVRAGAARPPRRDLQPRALPVSRRAWHAHLNSLEACVEGARRRRGGGGGGRATNRANEGGADGGGAAADAPEACAKKNAKSRAPARGGGDAERAVARSK